MSTDTTFTATTGSEYAHLHAGDTLYLTSPDGRTWTVEHVDEAQRPVPLTSENAGATSFDIFDADGNQVAWIAVTDISQDPIAQAAYGFEGLVADWAEQVLA